MVDSCLVTIAAICSMKYPPYLDLGATTETDGSRRYFVIQSTF